MHISETRHSSNTILTKCSKMTEEQHKRHGMNGNDIKDDPSPNKNYVQGGRLKFFKDGKFILELERAREGERVSWVSVPRKTFWPPQGTAASTPSYRQESSASLSVSDDNSSIQSSPWQRDHSWKQTSPRRNQSKELSFFFYRPKLRRCFGRNRKSRRPFSSITNDDVRYSDRTVKPRRFHSARPALLVVIQHLLEKTSTTGTRADVVSPRKRFLREMEKDNKVAVEDGCQKRSRNKTVVVKNGVSEEVKTLKNCSYSITSLLADDRNVKRSPSHSPSHFGGVPTQGQFSQTVGSSVSEERWYAESVDKLRSIELSQADKRGFPTYPHSSYLPHYMYSYPLPPYYGPNLFGRNYMVPPVYHAPPVPLGIRHETPSCSWAADPPRDLEHKEDNLADMPLNLSKHAG